MRQERLRSPLLTPKCKSMLWLFSPRNLSPEYDIWEWGGEFQEACLFHSSTVEIVQEQELTSLLSKFLWSAYKTKRNFLRMLALQTRHKILDLDDIELPSATKLTWAYVTVTSIPQRIWLSLSPPGFFGRMTRVKYCWASTFPECLYKSRSLESVEETFLKGRSKHV